MHLGQRKSPIEQERHLPKVNVLGALSKNHVHGVFFFKGNVTSDVCLHMLQNWLMDELIANEHEDFIYQQDGAPPHWRLTVRLISMTMCQRDGSRVLVVKTM